MFISIYVAYEQHGKSAKLKEVPETELSEENLSKGSMIVGIAGSGKTAFSMVQAINLVKRGLNFCWITTQGERLCSLIDYLPESCKDNIVLFAPYRKDSRGFNWLKCHNHTEDARHKRAKKTSALVKNIIEDVTDNISYGIYTATIAILEYWHITGVETTLYDVMKFIDDEDYRIHVTDKTGNKRILTRLDKLTDSTMTAISRKLNILLNDTALLRGLCYTGRDAFDFNTLFNKIFICDFHENEYNGLDADTAEILAKAVIIHFEIEANTRTENSPFYQIFCDEFYRYSEGIERILEQFPNRHRVHRVSTCLIWQRYTQMDKALLNTALSAANRWYMQMSAEDDNTLSKNESYKKHKGEFSNLETREYIAFLMQGKKVQQVRGKTPDLPMPNNHIYKYVVKNSRSLYTTSFRWWYECVTFGSVHS
jgi:hypothetical protein